MSLIDDYLKGIEPAKRAQLQRIRELAKEIVPSAQEKISYNMPTLTLNGKPFLGFNAHAKHIGIYPFSGKVISQLSGELSAYGLSRGAIRVPLDAPISKRLLKLVIMCRVRAIRAEIAGVTENSPQRRRTPAPSRRPSRTAAISPATKPPAG